MPLMKKKPKDTFDDLFREKIKEKPVNFATQNTFNERNHQKNGSAQESLGKNKQAVISMHVKYLDRA